MRLWSVLLIGATLAGCASGGKNPSGQPDWVSGDSKRFPPAFYLVGRGQSSELEAAKDRARADLAKVFEVAVSAGSDDYQRYQRRAQGAEESVESEQRVERHLETRTDRVLEGVEIPATWRDTTTGTYHVLAVLSKQAAAERLGGRIDELDKRTERFLKKARSTDDKLAQAAAAAEAWQAQLERAELQSTLQVVDRTGRGKDPKWSLAQLEADYGALVGRIRIRPEAGGDRGPALQEALAGALGAAGFMVMANGTPDYVLRGELQLRELAPRDGWHWYRGNLLLTVSDPEGRVRGTRRWELQEAATQRGLAEQRVLNRVGGILEEELQAAIVGLGGE